MRSTTDCDATSVFVFNLLAVFNHLAKVVESTRAIGISEDNVLPSNVPHTVGNCPAFPAVFLQCDHTDAAMRNMC
jgi:hypothetical protein